MSQLCIGGGSHPNVDASALLAGFGVSGPFWLTDAQYVSLALSPSGENWNPTSIDDVGSYGYAGMVIACMKARSLLFCNATPGDVAQTSALQQTALINTVGQLSSTLNAASQSAGIALSDSQKALQEAGDSASAIPVIGTIVGLVGSIVTAIFAAHAKAVQTQATALGKLCPAVTSAIAQIDAGVKIGTDSPAQAIAALQQLSSAFKQASAPYSKQCNAFCYYAAILDSIVASSSAVYACQGFIATEPVSLVSAPVSTGGVNEVSSSTASSAVSSSGASAVISNKNILWLGVAALVAFSVWEYAR